MKTVLATFIFMLMSFIFYQANAQISIISKGDEIKELKAEREQVVQQEKTKLAEDVENINKKLKKGEISEDEAERLKKEAAERRALDIEDKLNIIDSRIALLEREEGDDKDIRVVIGYNFLNKKEKETETNSGHSTPTRTTSSPFIAFGLNNAVPENGSLNDSPYKIGGSRFFEIGYEFTTNLSSFMRVKYGLAFQFNGLKPDNNQFFVQDGEQTYLAEYPLQLNKSKFRNDNIVLPLHFEFGKSEIKGGKNGYYSTEDHFKIGIGGYAGLNLNSVQKLKYEENGHKQKSKLKKNYNTTNFIYGLSAYIGYNWYALYVKYDLNPIFTDNLVEEHNVSIGVRLAF